MTVNELKAEKKRIESVLPNWIESLALPGKPFGRFKMHQAQEPPWLLYASQQMLSLAIDSGFWKNLDEERKKQWLELFMSCQDPESGLFICPVACRENAKDPAKWDVVSCCRPITVKLLKRLKEIDIKPKYPPPQAEKVCPSLEELPGSLASLPWETIPYSSGSHAGFWGIVRLQELAANNQDIYNDPYVNTIIDFLETRQNPETGFWSKCENLESGMNGLLKSLNVFRFLGRSLPRAETIVKTIISIQLEDGSFGTGSCSCWNAMVILEYITATTSIKDNKLIDVVLQASASLADSRQSDGLYSATPNGCLTAMGLTKLCDEPKKISDIHGTGHARGILELAEKIIDAVQESPPDSTGK